MTLGEMITRYRFLIPGAKLAKISDPVITGLLNQGADEVNLIAKVYKGYTDFTSVISKTIYSLSSYVPTYLGIAEDGVWYADSGGNLQRLYPRTHKKLSKENESWRDDSDGTPRFYYIEGDDLALNPPSAYERTVRVHHLKKATLMTNDDNYPWKNTTSEVTALKALDDPIIDYARWKSADALGKKAQGVLNYQEFLNSTTRAAKRVKRRPDITSDQSAGRMRH